MTNGSFNCMSPPKAPDAGPRARTNAGLLVDALRQLDSVELGKLRQSLRVLIAVMQAPRKARRRRNTVGRIDLGGLHVTVFVDVLPHPALPLEPQLEFLHVSA